MKTSVRFYYFPFHILQIHKNIKHFYFAKFLEPYNHNKEHYEQSRQNTILYGQAHRVIYLL